VLPSSPLCLTYALERVVGILTPTMQGPMPYLMVGWCLSSHCEFILAGRVVDAGLEL